MAESSADTLTEAPLVEFNDDTALDWLQQRCQHETSQDSYSICHELISTVLKWFKQVDITSISCIGYEVLNQFFAANVSCWEDVVALAITEGLAVACSFLGSEAIKKAILSVCMQHKHLLADMLKVLGKCCALLAKRVVQALYDSMDASDYTSRIGGESPPTKVAAKAGMRLVIIAGTKYFIYVGTKYAAKSAAKQATKAALKHGAKTVAKQGAKSAAKYAAKQGAKSAAKHTLKYAAKEGAKSAAKLAAKQGAKHAAKQGAKQAAKYGAKHAAKHAAKQGVKSAAKHGAKSAAKSAAKSGAKSGAKQMAKTASKAGTKLAAKSGAKAAAATVTAAAAMIATPIGLVADGIQMGMEHKGYKKEGKAVGAIGNAISGVLTGFVMAGPFGAVVGGAVGYGIWKGGELVGEYSDKMIDHLCPDEKDDAGECKSGEGEEEEDCENTADQESKCKESLLEETTNKEQKKETGFWASVGSWAGSYWSSKQS